MFVSTNKYCIINFFTVIALIIRATLIKGLVVTPQKISEFNFELFPLKLNFFCLLRILFQSVSSSTSPHQTLIMQPTSTRFVFLLAPSRTQPGLFLWLNQLWARIVVPPLHWCLLWQVTITISSLPLYQHPTSSGTGLVNYQFVGLGQKSICQIFLDWLFLRVTAGFVLVKDCKREGIK